MTFSPALKIGLIPLDERPVNTRYPRMVAEIAGASLVLPPPSILSNWREVADGPGLLNWLGNNVAGLDAVLASAETLGFGSLIASRISRETGGEVLTRLRALDYLKQDHPNLKLYVFSLIERVSKSNNATEEPLYWAEYGTRFYAYSQAIGRWLTGGDQGADRQARYLATTLPTTHRADFLWRRLRNHTVNLALLEGLAVGRYDLLLLTSDDTSPDGLPSRERTWLEDWGHLLELPNLLMHPGADEVGTVLVARLLNAGGSPGVYIDYALPEHAGIVAPYEDRPAWQSVLGQVKAVGAHPVSNWQEADLVLAVAPPSPQRREFEAAFAESERAVRQQPYRDWLTRLAGYQAHDKPVALADIAYPNGSDPLLLELLMEEKAIRLGSLAAYGAWNTAGNTLGVVLAQACVVLKAGVQAASGPAQTRFLLHRFLEDWGYQALVRQEVRHYLHERYNRPDPDPQSVEQIDQTCAFIERALSGRLAQLAQVEPAFAGYRLAPGSVRLPWSRTFEVDFELEKL